MSTDKLSYREKVTITKHVSRVALALGVVSVVFAFFINVLLRYSGGVS